MATSADAPPRVRQLASDLAQPRPMRRGSVGERTIRCGKAGCACAGDPKARHGPYHSLTQAVGGKTHSRFLTAEQAAIARQQVAAGSPVPRTDRRLLGSLRGMGRHATAVFTGGPLRGR